MSRKRRFKFSPARVPQPGETWEPPRVRYGLDDLDRADRELAEFDVFYEHADVSSALAKNPHYAWVVWCYAVSVGVAPPGWALAVMMEGAERYISRPQGDVADILKALGLATERGKRSYARQYADDQRAVKMALSGPDSRSKGARLRNEFTQAERGRRLLKAVGASYLASKGPKKRGLRRKPI